MEAFFHFLFILIFINHTKYGDLMIINDSNVLNKIKENKKEKHKTKKALQAFFFGGLIGLIAQALYVLFNDAFKINEDISTLLSSGTIIVLSFILTGIGIFDKLVSIAYAGVLIPISGFANSVTSCAIEGKAEGLIFGIGGKIFSLIGSVCTYGIVSSMILGFIYYIYRVIINA